MLDDENGKDKPMHLADEINQLKGSIRLHPIMSLRTAYRNLEILGYCLEGNSRVLYNRFTNAKFNYNHHPDAINYERIAICLKNIVYALMKEVYKLLPVQIPLNNSSCEPVSCIFASGSETKSEKLLILIHGMGAVRAGQWSRRLMINQSLQAGSQLPFILTAQNRGFHVIVTNTNQNVDMESEIGLVRGSDTPEEHVSYVWHNFIKNSEYQSIFIVAHSYGGKVIMDLVRKEKCVRDKVTAMALTDSVHTVKPVDNNTAVWLNRNCVNYVTSDNPVDSFELSKRYDCQRRSAGTLVHEETSWKAMTCIFKFFQSAQKQESTSLDNLQQSVKQKLPNSSEEDDKHKTTDILSTTEGLATEGFITFDSRTYVKWKGKENKEIADIDVLNNSDSSTNVRFYLILAI